MKILNNAIIFSLIISILFSLYKKEDIPDFIIRFLSCSGITSIVIVILHLFNLI